MTVLILGKQIELGHYRAEFLQSYGIHVLFPENKNSAVSAIRAGGFDVVVLSYTVDPETAKELVELLKECSPDAPLITIVTKRWDDTKFNPAETLLDTDPPKALLEAIHRIQKRLATNNPPAIRRVK